MRKGVNAVADRRPNETQHRANENNGERSDDRHGTFAREEAEIRRQLYPVEAIETPGRDHADDDAAEDAGLDRGNAHDRRDLDAAEFCAHAHRDRKSTRLNSSHGYISY